MVLYCSSVMGCRKAQGCSIDHQAEPQNPGVSVYKYLLFVYVFAHYMLGCDYFLLLHFFILSAWQERW